MLNKTDLPEKNMLIVSNLDYSISFDNLDKNMLTFVDKFSSTAVDAVLKNIEFLYKISSTYYGHVFVLIYNLKHINLYTIKVVP